MYLVELDPLDGMVLIGKQFDGVMAIKEFRNVVNDKELGRACMTAIALSVDHLSKIKYQTPKDRPGKAMKVVTNNLNKWVWNQEKIQLALKKYDELQYDPVIEEKRLLDGMLTSTLIEIRDFKGIDADKIQKFSQLEKIQKLVESWNRKNEDLNPYAGGPVEEGYTLSRLEEKERDRHSFYNENTKS